MKRRIKRQKVSLAARTLGSRNFCQLEQEEERTKAEKRERKAARLHALREAAVRKHAATLSPPLSRSGVAEEGERESL
eukprot:754827-Hanusia_phi.AAC.6